MLGRVRETGTGQHLTDTSWEGAPAGHSGSSSPSLGLQTCEALGIVPVFGHFLLGPRYACAWEWVGRSEVLGLEFPRNSVGFLLELPLNPSLPYSALPIWSTKYWENHLYWDFDIRCCHKKKAPPVMKS